jgi:predicted transcriptional regulator
MSTQLTDGQKQALRENDGFVQVDDADEPCLLISMQAFREMMGVGSADEYQASLDAVEAGIADIEAGRTVPMASFFKDFDRRHGL